MTITTDLTASSLTHAKNTIPKNTPVVILNLLKFRDIAEYPEDHADHGKSGQFAYLERYLPAFAAIAAKSEDTKSITPIFIGAVLTPLVAPEDDSWDVVALVEYPNFEAFLKVADSDEYRETAEPHRLAALKNLRLIVTAKQSLGYSGQL